MTKAKRNRPKCSSLRDVCCNNNKKLCSSNCMNTRKVVGYDVCCMTCMRPHGRSGRSSQPSTMAFSSASAGPSNLTYWIIVPENGTDAAVHSIRHSWMLGAGADARFCVARGLSSSKDRTLHWLTGLEERKLVASSRSLLNDQLSLVLRRNSSLVDALGDGAAAPPPPPKAAQNKQLSEHASMLRRKYNNFLRHKVFEIMREICRASKTRGFDFAFMMDAPPPLSHKCADTSVNRTNLEAFVAQLKPSEALYTGNCRRRWAAGNRHVLRGVGGGSGILFSRGLLQKACPALEHCAPLRSMMDKLEHSGGDLMIAKCLEFLGVRCQLADELGLPELDLADLFRRGPPWVYPPLPQGAVLVAPKSSSGARDVMRQQKSKRRTPHSAVIAFHRMMPLVPTAAMRDARCRVLAEYVRKLSGPANWYSRCLPHFALLGVPKSGSTSAFNWLLQHPEMRAPLRKELHMWAPVATADKACLDRRSCAAVAARAAGPRRLEGGGEEERHAAGGDGARAPRLQRGARGGRGGRTRAAETLETAPATMAVKRVLSAYLELFPAVDPREFALTGEASPAYVYSASAALFFGSRLMSHARLLLLLRDPAERALSEFKNKRDLAARGGSRGGRPGQWVWGHQQFGALVKALRPASAACAPAQLYAACEPCRRFAAAPAAERAAGGAEAPQPSGGADAGGDTCAVPPVVWQSWYHLFLPRWLGLGNKLLLEFSDDLFGDAPAVMQRARAFLGLHPFAFDTAAAYNTENKRGARIATGNASRNAQAASAARHSHAEAPPAQMRVLERLVADAALRTDELLRTSRWRAAPQQHRRSVPEAWLTRYRNVALSGPRARGASSRKVLFSRAAAEDEPA